MTPGDKNLISYMIPSGKRLPKVFENGRTCQLIYRNEKDGGSLSLTRVCIHLYPNTIPLSSIWKSLWKTIWQTIWHRIKAPFSHCSLLFSYGFPMVFHWKKPYATFNQIGRSTYQSHGDEFSRAAWAPRRGCAARWSWPGSNRCQQVWSTGGPGTWWW